MVALPYVNLPEVRGSGLWRQVSSCTATTLDSRSAGCIEVKVESGGRGAREYRVEESRVRGCWIADGEYIHTNIKGRG